jgi:hypothetical protein
LAEKALVAAYVAESRTVEPLHVEAAIKEANFSGLVKKRPSSVFDVVWPSKWFSFRHVLSIRKAMLSH